MLMRGLLALTVVGAVAWAITQARDSRPAIAIGSGCGDSAAISLTPATPTLGALFRVRVSGASPEAHLAGVVAGEPLHFHADSAGGSQESLAPVPIDSPDSLLIVVRCTMNGASDSLVAHVRTGSGNYPVERLRVAPAFGRPPDPATTARIERESQRAVNVATGAHTTARLWNEPFALPRDARITSGFGGGREYNGAITSRHMGTDFAGATGSPVRAANRGVVRIVDAFYYGGNVVYIDHGVGLSSAYLHLSAQLVAAGDTVQRGQTIGRVGATGRVTGPHLHFIVRYGSVTVDPLSLFAIAGDSSGRGR
ncbi:MAG TPA: M23 family metallopeptidase [Gemmatimonadaceae bacterium]